MDIERIQESCKKLPAVKEEIKWDNDLVYTVGGKMFLVVALDPPFRCSFKVGDEEFEELVLMEGFIPAPYLARAKWVQVGNETRISFKDLELRIQQSYELVKLKLTKKIRQELGI
jgi:predicted DNA-binding protein (MmcQ/YjbR family)